jgi:hypothetical protein
MFTGMVNATMLWTVVLLALVLLPWPARETGALDRAIEASR